jgi:hypothetical protein
VGIGVGVFVLVVEVIMGQLSTDVVKQAHHPGMDPARRRRLAAAALVAAAGAAAAVPLLTGPLSDWEPNLGRERPYAAKVGGLEAVVRQMPGPPNNPNAIVVQVGLSSAQSRVAWEAYDVHLIVSDISRVTGDVEARSRPQPCVAPRGMRLGEPLWECSYIIDRPSVWHLDFVVSRAGAELGTVRALVDTPEAVELYGDSAVSPADGGDAVPATWYLGALGLAVVAVAAHRHRARASR